MTLDEKLERIATRGARRSTEVVWDASRRRATYRVPSRRHRLRSRHLGIAAVVILAALGVATLLDGSGAPSTPDGGLMAHPIGQMEHVTTWWWMDIGPATTGAGAGDSLEDRPDWRLSPDGLELIVDHSGHPDEPIYTFGFEEIRSLGGGLAIVGTHRSAFEDSPELHEVHIVALVKPDGSLEFVPKGRGSSWHDATWAAYVAEKHSGRTAEDVLLELANADDFSDFSNWWYSLPLGDRWDELLN